MAKRTSSISRIGKLYEGKWKVISFQHYGSTNSNGKYILINVFNNKEISISKMRLLQVERGENSISKIISNKITKKWRFMK